MDQNQYQRFLDDQIADARHNMEHDEKTYQESKAKYEALLKLRESYSQALFEKEMK